MENPEDARRRSPRVLRVLHLEDNPLDAQLIREMLQSGGIACEMKVATNKTDFLNALSNQKFDLILSDCTLPSFDGIRAMRIAKEWSPEIPFIFVSGTLGEDLAVQTLKSGATDYVLKHRLTRLVPSVQRALEELEEREARKAAEAKLDYQKEFTRVAFENIDASIMACNQEGTLTYFNEAAHRLLDFPGQDLPQEEWSGNGILKNTDGSPVSAQDHPLARALRGESVSAEEYTVQPPHGEMRTFMVNGQTILDRSENQIGAVIVLQDITELKRIERHTQLVQRMEAVGQLAGGVAHDFNNILMAITAYSELLLISLAGNEQLHHPVNEILKVADKGASLVRQLLAFSRRQTLAPKVLNLNDVVEGMVPMLRRLMQEDIEIKINFEQSGRLKADPGQVEQVIMNLALNARDAMPTGGTLKIQTASVDFDETMAEAHEGIAPGFYVTLTVSDTGIGMDEYVRSRIFEPFFTTKGEEKGTGLGLSTVYGIVKQAGGYIWVYSEPGNGTIFKVYFPREDEDQPAVPLKEIRKKLTGSETILMVDDNEAVLKAISALLEVQGYTVLQAENAEHALQIAETHPGKINLVVTDMVMTRMNGYELAEKLYQKIPEIKVICMSGYSESFVTRHGSGVPDIAYLQKPAPTETLLREIRRLLDKKPDSSQAR